MSEILKIEITESEEQLRQLLKQVKEPIVKEMVQVLYWIKMRQAETVNHLATLVGRYRTTVSRWLSEYRLNGIVSLRKIGKSLGRRGALAANIIDKIKEELKEPEGFQSYSEIVRWLNAVYNLEVSYTVVYTLPKYRTKIEKGCRKRVS